MARSTRLAHVASESDAIPDGSSNSSATNTNHVNRVSCGLADRSALVVTGMARKFAISTRSLRKPGYQNRRLRASPPFVRNAREGCGWVSQG